MKKLLLTGYSGFIGRHLVKELKNNFVLIGLGRRTHKDISHFNADLGQCSNYDKALEGVSVVIHIAAKIKEDAFSHPIEAFRLINVEATIDLAKQAVKAGVKRFIFISTIKVNGERTLGNRPFKPQDVCSPIDPYSISKAEAEGKLLALGRETGLEIVIIRPPLVYGKGVKANFSALMRIVSRGIPLPFRALNRKKRSLVSVYNLVNLISVCINHPAASNQVFLVSDDNDLTMAEIVSLMAKVQHKRDLSLPVPVWCFKFLGILFNRSESVNRITESLQLDITHTKNTLNWLPPYSVEHGFKQAAESNSTEKI